MEGGRGRGMNKIHTQTCLVCLHEPRCDIHLCASFMRPLLTPIIVNAAPFVAKFNWFSHSQRMWHDAEAYLNLALPFERAAQQILASVEYLLVILPHLPNSLIPC